jgi:PAS domain S-box-containing protein
MNSVKSPCETRNKEKEIVRYHQLIEQTPNPIFVVDRKGIIRFWNAACEEKFEYSKREVLGKNVHDVFTIDFGEIIKRALNGEVLSDLELEFKKGLHMISRVFPIRSETGKIIECAIDSIDITERKKMKDILKESEEKFRLMAEYSLVGIYLIQDWKFKYVNSKLAEIFGYEVDELIEKKGPEDLVHPDDWHIVRDNLRRRIKGEIKAVNYSFRCIRKDGEVIYVEVFGSRMDYKGKPAIFGMLIDVTDRIKAIRKLEENLEQFDHLADELRNPVAIITGYLELKREIEAEEILKKISTQVKKIRGILDELRKHERMTHKIRREFTRA